MVSGSPQVNNHSGWLQMKNGGGFPRRTMRTKNGALQMENNNIRL